jgi:hypothetical protein
LLVPKQDATDRPRLLKCWAHILINVATRAVCPRGPGEGFLAPAAGPERKTWKEIKIEASRASQTAEFALLLLVNSKARSVGGPGYDPESRC